MREIVFWRGSTLVLGLVAVASWAVPPFLESGADPGAAVVSDAAVVVDAGATPSAAARLARARERRLGDATSGALADRLGAADVVTVDGALMERARAEVRAELAAEHRERSEERFSEILDRVSAFADAHDLPAETEEALVASFSAMHERMSALGPPSPGEDEAVRDQKREAMRASFETLRADLGAALGDEALVEELEATIRPGGRGGPPGPPP